VNLQPDNDCRRPRCLFVSSNPDPCFDTDSTEGLFKRKQYSLACIGYYLERLGWQTRRIGRQASLTPRRIIRHIDTFQPDIIYTYGTLIALNPILARRFCGWSKFTVVHGWDDDYRDVWRYNYGPLAGRLGGWLERRIMRHSDGVATLSRFNQARGLDWGVVSEYIPNGCDPPVFDPSACKIRLEGELKLVYTGDQAPMKRTEDICRAMRKVPGAIKLYLTGQHYPYLDQYASDNCVFLGFLEKNDQWSVVNQADVAVCTADHDCNAKLHEYLRMNKPILGYDGRANLFFRNGHNALLTRDYPGAIMRLYREPELRQRLAENAAHDIPVYTWIEIAGMYDQFFRRVLGEQAGTYYASQNCL
jgi:glycosyltransferase involved in cell wall biosynthesis